MDENRGQSRKLDLVLNRLENPELTFDDVPNNDAARSIDQADADSDSVENIFDEAAMINVDQIQEIGEKAKVCGESVVPVTPSISGNSLSPTLSQLPVQVHNEMPMLSKLWSDQVDMAENQQVARMIPGNEVNDEPFAVVLTKSQKKKIRQRNKQTTKEVVHHTRSRAGPNNLANEDPLLEC